MSHTQTRHNLTDHLGFHNLAVDHFGDKFKLAVIVCLVDVLESISIAKALAYKHKYELM